MFDDQYLGEVKKSQIVSHLESIKRRCDYLLRIIDDMGDVPKEVKVDVLEMKDFSKSALDFLLGQELMRQKEMGKEFLSDEEIDKIVNNIKKDFSE